MKTWVAILGVLLVSGSVCHGQTCFGVAFDDPSVCSGHGVCVDEDVCQCDSAWTGDACDSPADSDDDGFPDNSDNCPTVSNPDQADADSDGFGDLCDNCPDRHNRGQEDRDGDGICDICYWVGTPVSWGSQKTPDAPLESIIQIAAGYGHSFALKSDGSIVAWGSDDSGQARPPSGNDFVEIATGGGHSLALRNDGSIVAWGDDEYGQASPAFGQ